MDFGASGLILDTNALSATGDQHPSVVTIISTARRLAVPVIAIGEYRHGIARSRHWPRYREWLDAFLNECQVLDITNETTHHYASIHLELRQIGKPIPINDLWIAALCRQHDLPLLSRDSHFDVVRGLKRISW